MRHIKCLVIPSWLQTVFVVDIYDETYETLSYHEWDIERIKQSSDQKINESNTQTCNNQMIKESNKKSSIITTGPDDPASDLL